MRTLVVIPTYNERGNIEALVGEILALLPELDILIVDDNSPDGTGQAADLLARRTPRVRVLHRAGKQGLGTAYVAGFTYALAEGYDRVVEMDSDFSHRPEDLPAMLAATRWADVVIGSRNVAGGQALNWSPVRHLISKGGSAFARVVLGMPIQDCTSGFKAFRRSAIERLDLAALGSNGYAFQLEVNYACVQSGQRIVEVPIVFPDRTRGTSKMSWGIVVEAVWLVLRLRTGLSRVAVQELPDPVAAVEVHTANV